MGLQCAAGQPTLVLPCRLASTRNSTELSGKAARSVCAIIEADAEALWEANSAHGVVSIDLEAPEHYCSPIFWQACVSLPLLYIHDLRAACSCMPLQTGSETLPCIFAAFI